MQGRAQTVEKLVNFLKGGSRGDANKHIRLMQFSTSTMHTYLNSFWSRIKLLIIITYNLSAFPRPSPGICRTLTISFKDVFGHLWPFMIILVLRACWNMSLSLFKIVLLFSPFLIVWGSQISAALTVVVSQFQCPPLPDYYQQFPADSWMSYMIVSYLHTRCWLAKTFCNAETKCVLICWACE